MLPLLDSLIKSTVDTSALDPIFIIDYDKPLGEVVYDTLTILRARLFRAGFREYKQSVCAKKNIIDNLRNYQLPNVVLTPNENTGNYLYILTNEANGIPLIHPPYDDNNQIMSWDEYFKRKLNGEEVRLMIVAPWAQARIEIKE